MTLVQKRILFYLVWFLLLILGPYTILQNTSWLEVNASPLLLINFFQRLTGLTLFTLIFVQVVLGSFMGKWIRGVLGAKGYWFHVTQGLFTYGLILAHPIMQSLIDFKTEGLTYALIRIFPSFASRADIYMTFGKIALVLFSIGVFAAYFRAKPFFRRNWKNFHRLNYIGFYFVAVHSWFIGSDVTTPPFYRFYFCAITVISGVVIYKIYRKILLQLFEKALS